MNPGPNPAHSPSPAPQNPDPAAPDLKAIIVIPARYASVRFPGKMLAELDGKPLIWHVVQQAGKAKRASRVLVATDDERIRKTVVEFGGEAVLTSPRCPSGTDRVAEATQGMDVDVIVNVQGDEPTIDPESLDRLIALFERDFTVEMATLAVSLKDPAVFSSPDVVKVVVDGWGNALYFSRAPIPLDRSRPSVPTRAFKHLGVYAYRPDALRRFISWRPGQLEQIEKLEQLRALENGMMIRVLETRHDSIGVDTPEELAAVRKQFGSKRNED